MKITVFCGFSIKVKKFSSTLSIHIVKIMIYADSNVRSIAFFHIHADM